MSIALASSSFHRLLLARQMHLWDIPGEARVLGFSSVDLDDLYLLPPGLRLFGNLRRYISPPSPAPAGRSYDYGLLSRLRDALQYDQVQIAAWGCDPLLGEPDLLARARAYIRLALETASRIDAPVVRLTVAPETAPRSIPQIVDTLETVVVDAERLGVRLALENHTPAASPELLLGIVQGVHSPWLGLCLNLGYLPADTLPGDFDQMALRSFHVRAALESHDEGTFARYRELIDRLKARGYSGAIAVVYAGEDDPVAGIRQAHSLIRRMWV